MRLLRVLRCVLGVEDAEVSTVVGGAPLSGCGAVVAVVVLVVEVVAVVGGGVASGCLARRLVTGGGGGLTGILLSLVLARALSCWGRVGLVIVVVVVVIVTVVAAGGLCVFLVDIGAAAALASWSARASQDGPTSRVTVAAAGLA
jgi:hypothetical protein